VRGSCDLLLEFWDPLHISGTVIEARNFKFGMQIGHLAMGGPKRNNAKLGQKGLRDLLFEILGPPLYLGNG